jgi:hypothetical protein
MRHMIQFAIQKGAVEQAVLEDQRKEKARV